MGGHGTEPGWVWVRGGGGGVEGGRGGVVWVGGSCERIGIGKTNCSIVAEFFEFSGVLYLFCNVEL